MRLVRERRRRSSRRCAQLLPLLFAADVWRYTRARLSEMPDLKQRLTVARGQIAPVRNEIAHVREVGQERLMRASVACTDVSDEGSSALVYSAAETVANMAADSWAERYFHQREAPW